MTLAYDHPTDSSFYQMVALFEYYGRPSNLKNTDTSIVGSAPEENISPECDAYHPQAVENALEGSRIKTPECSACDEIVKSMLEEILNNIPVCNYPEVMVVESVLEETLINIARCSDSEEILESSLEGTLTNIPMYSDPVEMVVKSVLEEILNNIMNTPDCSLDEMVVESSLEENPSNIQGCSGNDPKEVKSVPSTLLNTPESSQSVNKSDTLCSQSQDSEEMPHEFVRAECSYCHRYFSLERLPVHERICRMAYEKKEMRLRNDQPSIIVRFAALSTSKRLKLIRKAASRGLMTRCISLKNLHAITVQNDLPEETPSTDDERIECTVCHRRFCPTRIAIHESICKTLNKTKRVPFKPSMNRLLRSFNTFKRIPKQISDTCKLLKLKQKDELGFQKFIEFPRERTETYLVKYENSRETSPPSTSHSPYFITCPHCGEKFEEAAAAEHMSKCKDLTTN